MGHVYNIRVMYYPFLLNDSYFFGFVFLPVTGKKGTQILLKSVKFTNFATQCYSVFGIQSLSKFDRVLLRTGAYSSSLI